MDEYHHILDLIDVGDVDELVNLVECPSVQKDKGYFLLRFNDAFHPTTQVIQLISAGYCPALFVSRLIDYQSVFLLETVLYDYNVKLSGCNLDRYYRLEKSVSKDLTNIIKKYTTKKTTEEYNKIISGTDEHFDEYAKYMTDEEKFQFCNLVCVYCDKDFDVCVCSEICEDCGKKYKWCVCVSENDIDDEFDYYDYDDDTEFHYYNYDDSADD